MVFCWVKESMLMYRWIIRKAGKEECSRSHGAYELTIP